MELLRLRAAPARPDGCAPVRKDGCAPVRRDDFARDLLSLTTIRAAAARLAPHLAPTELQRAARLSQHFGRSIYLKLETGQVTGSFKERGGLNKLAQLGAIERRQGVIAMSAGNHAQGLARHAARLGIAATLVMPETTPDTKIAGTRRFGARVVLHGDSVEAAMAEARRLAAVEHLVFVHPYDDPDVIAGQGTVAVEMLEAEPELDCLLVPVGGGGLLAGMAVAAKAIKSSIRVIGVRLDRAGATGPSLADGIAVRCLGKLTRRIADGWADDILAVSEAQIAQGMSLLVRTENRVAEGAGVAGIAALIAGLPVARTGRRVGVVLSGGNVDPARLASVLAAA